MPVDGDVKAAKERLKTIKVYPLEPDRRVDRAAVARRHRQEQDTTPLQWEDNFTFWEVLHKTVEAEPAYEGYRDYYGELAALGIEKGKPFAPGRAHEARYSSRRPRRRTRRCGCNPSQIAVPTAPSGRIANGNGPALRFEDGDFNAPTHVDLDAREKWFYQAIGASPAMFRRDTQAGSLYWLGLRDNDRRLRSTAARRYRLTVPLPVPGKLFWSVTVYDIDTRSQIQTEQNKAALRSLFELKDLSGESRRPVLRARRRPRARKAEWIQTIPGKGWFVYFRIYGPEEPAFDGTWKPGDFEIVTGSANINAHPALRARV